MTEVWGYTIKIIAGFEPHMIRTHLLEQGKKQEGKTEQQLMNTEKTGGDSPQWLRSTTDID